MNRKFTLILALTLFSALLWSNPLLGSQEEDLPQAPRRGGKTIEKLVQWQLELKDRMGEYFQELQEENNRIAFFSILGLSFIYGIVHAAGPGHRKTIIFSLFLGRKSRWWEPLSAGFFSAGLHGLSGLVLIIILHAISRRMLGSRINRTTLYLEGITYLVLLAVALLLLILKILELTGKREHHHHGNHSSRKGLYGTLAVGSLFPCPGAVMILMFSLAIGQLTTGSWAILALSLGMGVTVSSTAYLALAGQRTLFLALKKREQLVEKLSSIMELGAYLFLGLYSIWAVIPFLVSLT